MKKTILIIDDHDLVRQGIAALLRVEKDLKVIGGASNGPDGLTLALEKDPDLVLMDIGLPLLNGIETTRRILEKKPDMRVLAISGQDSPFYVREMIQAGAIGFIHKGDDFRELVQGIRCAFGGVPFMSHSVATKAMEDYFQVLKDGKVPHSRENLSSREIQTLQLIAEGKTSKEIGELLQISNKTAENHRHNVMEKLGVHNVAGLTLWAAREGIIQI